MKRGGIIQANFPAWDSTEQKGRVEGVAELQTGVVWGHAGNFGLYGKQSRDCQLDTVTHAATALSENARRLFWCCGADNLQPPLHGGRPPSCHQAWSAGSFSPG